MTPVHALALGARTPVGLRAEPSLAAIRAHISMIAEHPFFVDLRGQPVRVARDTVVDVGLAGTKRMLEFARCALDEIAEKLGDQALRGGTIPVTIALPERRPGFGESEARWLVDELARTSRFGTAAKISFVLNGHAGGLQALHLAAQSVSSRASDLHIVGGVDSYLQSETLAALDVDGRLAADTVRSGFHPGEGACFIALASPHTRSALDLPSLGQVIGGHSSFERATGRPDALTVGHSLAEAIRGAAGQVSGPASTVDEIYCDINGERARTEEWGFALLRTRELWRDPSVYSTAVAECGDMGAASGPLLVALALWMGIRKCADGPRALVWAASDGGLRSAVALNRL